VAVAITTLKDIVINKQIRLGNFE